MILTDPREISPLLFPKNGSIEDKIYFLLHYAILAPSNLNSQPWKFKVQENTVLFYPDESLWIKILDPSKHELFISLGCALENFLIAAKHFGFLTNVCYFTDYVKVGLEETDINNPSPLFHWIAKRFTYRGLFKNKKLSSNDFKNTDNELLSLRLITNKKEIRKISTLSLEANIFRFIHPKYKNALLNEVSMEKFERMLTNFIYEISNILYEKQEVSTVFHNISAFGFLLAKKVDASSCIKIGQFFEKLCLKACSMQMCVLPHSNLLEVPLTKKKFAQMFFFEEDKIMQTFCLGYPKNTTPDHYSSRVSLDKKLM